MSDQSTNQSVQGLWQLLEECARELARLIVPLSCVGCARPDHILCQQCTGHFFAEPRPVTAQIPYLGGLPIEVWACGSYAEPLNQVIMGWKDGRREDVGPRLIRIMAAATGQIAPQLLNPSSGAAAGPMLSAAAGPPLKSAPHQPVSTILVVPLPSSKSSRRTRGFVPADELAKGVIAGLLSYSSPDVRVLLGAGLTVGPKKRDQVGLDARKRSANLSGSMTASTLLQKQSQAASAIILVDDLVTTGATMREVLRVLPRQKGTLVAGMALCVTPVKMKTESI